MYNLGPYYHNQATAIFALLLCAVGLLIVLRQTIEPQHWIRNRFFRKYLPAALLLATAILAAFNLIEPIRRWTDRPMEIAQIGSVFAPLVMFVLGFYMTIVVRWYFGLLLMLYAFWDLIGDIALYAD